MDITLLLPCFLLLSMHSLKKAYSFSFFMTNSLELNDLNLKVTTYFLGIIYLPSNLVHIIDKIKKLK